MPAQTQQWRFGPVDVIALPHEPGLRGEPQVRDRLAHWLGDPQAPPPLARDEWGRPRLLAPYQDRDAGWSHSGEQLLLALGRDVVLGVDLERQRPRKQMRKVIRRFFHPKKIAWLDALDDSGCEHWFFRVWCAKTALLKAHGHGISFGLEKLRFAPDAAEALQLVWCDPGLGDATRWHLYEWQATEDFRAALAWYPL